MPILPLDEIWGQVCLPSRVGDAFKQQYGLNFPASYE